MIKDGQAALSGVCLGFMLNVVPARFETSQVHDGFLHPR